MTSENQEKIQEMHVLEHSLQNLFLQKQSFQMELNETQNALKEASESNEDLFKIVGQLMIKTSKTKILDDLGSKEKLIEARLKSFENQEKSLIDQLEALRKELNGY